MTRTGIFLSFLMLAGVLYAQAPLTLKYNAYELLSTRSGEIDGVLTDPKMSPVAERFFAISSQTRDNRSLYIYDIKNRSLRTISATQTTLATGDEINLATANYATSYNYELDWRPIPDKQGRQWYVFVSNGLEDNHDLYLGVVGGTRYYRLTQNIAIDMMPKWSPDGNSIAFISYRSGDGDVYLLTDMNKMIADPDGDDADLNQVTATALEETDLAWNPNPDSKLLAYAKRESYPGRDIDTYQIRVLDLGRKKARSFLVTNDQLTHFNRPLWDRNRADRLLYVGKSVLENSQTNLFLSELAWDGEKELQNKVLEGYKTEIFRNVRMSNTHALWLSGSQAIVCQENNRLQNNRLYSVNVEKWINKIEGAVHYFEELHRENPFIREFSEVDGNFLFVTREGEISSVFLAQMEGEDIDWTSNATPTGLTNPGEGTNFFAAPVLLSGGAIAAGAAALFLLRGGDDGDTQSVPIGLPPSLPRE